MSIVAPSQSPKSPEDGWRPRLFHHGGQRLVCGLLELDAAQGPKREHVHYTGPSVQDFLRGKQKGCLDWTELIARSW